MPERRWGNKPAHTSAYTLLFVEKLGDAWDCNAQLKQILAVELEVSSNIHLFVEQLA
jgi:hypothetical protein